MSLASRLVVSLLLGLVAARGMAGTTVSFASLDAPAGQPVQLKGDWHPVDAPEAGAVVLLHGCGGAHDRQGRPSERTREYTQLLNGQGMHVLVLDSFGPRGEREICTQRTGTRRITMANRRLDALAALRWLAQQKSVDAQRLGFIGWSNGGSTVLSATNQRHRAVAVASPEPAFAVAYYPGCESELKRGYRPSAPLLMLVGEADDWTPAAPCHQLAKASAEPRPQIEGYAEAHHGFDSSSPVRLRRDVPNGVNPGQGVHVGGQPEALAASRARLLQFLHPYVTRP